MYNHNLFFGSKYPRFCLGFSLFEKTIVQSIELDSLSTIEYDTIKNIKLSSSTRNSNIEIRMYKHNLFYGNKKPRFCLGFSLLSKTIDQSIELDSLSTIEYDTINNIK